MIHQLKALGAPEAEIQRAVRAAAVARLDSPADRLDAVRVAPHLAQVVGLFADLRTQWKVVAGGMGGLVYVGLDYVAAEAVLRFKRAKVTDRALLFKWLREMELAARAEMNKAA